MASFMSKSKEKISLLQGLTIEKFKLNWLQHKTGNKRTFLRGLVKPFKLYMHCQISLSGFPTQVQNIQWNSSPSWHSKEYISQIIHNQTYQTKRSVGQSVSPWDFCNFLVTTGTMLEVKHGISFCNLARLVVCGNTVEAIVFLLCMSGFKRSRFNISNSVCSVRCQDTAGFHR